MNQLMWGGADEERVCRLDPGHTNYHRASCGAWVIAEGRGGQREGGGRGVGREVEGGRWSII